MNVRHDVGEETGCRSGVQEREDVRVLELSGDLDLAQEAAGPHSVRELGMEYFDGHSPTVTHVLGQVHSGHSASPELTLQCVIAA
jgi:hypothetical protein